MCPLPQLVQSLHALSHHVLFHNLSSPEQILAVFPESFHSSLKNLITKILLEHRSDPPERPAGAETVSGQKLCEVTVMTVHVSFCCFSARHGGRKL